MAENQVKWYTVHLFWYFSRISHNYKFGDQLKSKIDHEHGESQTVRCPSQFRWKVLATTLHFNRIFYDSNFILLIFIIIRIRPLFLRKLVTKCFDQVSSDILSLTHRNTRSVSPNILYAQQYVHTFFLASFDLYNYVTSDITTIEGGAFISVVRAVE